MRFIYMTNRDPEVTSTLPRRRDYYAILGLPPQADGADVGPAYWQRAREYHAHASTDALASAMLEALNEAAEVLGTPALRHKYDALCQEAPIAHPQRQINAGVAPQSAVATGVAAGATLKRLGLRALLLAVTGLASVAASAGASAHQTKIIAGPPITSAPVIFLGDSITGGAGASSLEATFAQVLRQRLGDARFTEGSGDYSTVISALGGQLVDLRYSQAIGREARSLIIVEVGAHSVVEDQGLSSEEFGAGYGLMLDCLRGTGATIVVSTIPWLGWDRTEPLYLQAAERSAIIREEADRRAIPVADVWNALRDHRDLLSPDAFHPNDAGHRLIADLFWRQIEPLLGRPRADFRDQCDYDRVLALRSRASRIAAGSASGG